MRPPSVAITALAWASLAFGCSHPVPPDHPSPDAVMVVFATRRIEPGTVLTSDDLVEVRMPSHLVPDAAARQLEAVLGRVPREVLLPGEPLRPERLAGAETGVGLGALIPRGMRAMEMRADHALIEPRDLIDVVADRPDGPCTLLQVVQVVAVQPGVLTIALTPADAATLVAARNRGHQLHPSLRNRIDAAAAPASTCGGAP